MCGFIPILDLGATNFQSSVQNVGALDLGCLSASHLESFLPANIAITGCQHLAHLNKNTTGLEGRCLEGDG